MNRQSYQTKDTITACPCCDLTWEDFQGTGRLGCDFCYQAFRDVLSPLLGKTQKGMQHTGKSPQTPHGSHTPSIDIEIKELARLDEELARAIAAEAFEEAAALRDKRHALENKLHGCTNTS
ncbi:MAG: hypothetical protein K9N51_06220 [Candidatus Pacebacteria bacterium]|nr:hypothetical protein [Candidatus Paceibacterota bacterium]